MESSTSGTAASSQGPKRSQSHVSKRGKAISSGDGEITTAQRQVDCSGSRAEAGGPADSAMTHRAGVVCTGVASPTLAVAMFGWKDCKRVTKAGEGRRTSSLQSHRLLTCCTRRLRCHHCRCVWSYELVHQRGMR
jgi:hypothetical protein